MSLPEQTEDSALVEIRAALEKTNVSTKRKVVEKFVLAALSSIPWVGGFISAAASLKVDQRKSEKDSLQTKWLEEHSKKMHHLVGALTEVANRLDNLGDTIDERIQNEEYLGLVRSAFRTWDRAETEDKRRYVANLVSNAAGCGPADGAFGCQHARATGHATVAQPDAAQTSERGQHAASLDHHLLGHAAGGARRAAGWPPVHHAPRSAARAARACTAGAGHG